MRCSECSNLVRPAVAIDIDGTLGNYHHHLQFFAELYLQHTLPGGYDGSVSMDEWWGMDKAEYRQIKLAYRQGGQKRSMPAYDGAYQFMRNLWGLGVEIWITTTRPYLRLDGVDPDTRFWLGNQGIVYDGLLYDDDKYAKLAQNLDPGRVIAVVDDLGPMVDEAVKQFSEGVAIQVVRPHNRAPTARRRGQEIDGFVNIFQQIQLKKEAWDAKQA